MFDWLRVLLGRQKDIDAVIEDRRLDATLQQAESARRRAITELRRVETLARRGRP
jgi:multidrug resistance efflux pump